MIKFARGSSDPRRRLVLARLPRGIPTIFQSRFEIIKMSSEKASRSQDFSFDSSLVDFVSDRFSTVIEKSNRSFNLGCTFSISVDRSRKKFRITCREYVLKNSGGTCVKRKPFRMLFMGRFSQREGGGGGGVNRTRREFRRSNIKYEIAKIALPSISLCTVSRKLKLNFYWNTK